MYIQFLYNFTAASFVQIYEIIKNKLNENQKKEVESVLKSEI